MTASANPRDLVRQEHRSQLESSDLAKVIAETEKISNNLNSKVFRGREQNDYLPTYFDSVNSLPLDDKKVEILTLDLNHLPRRIDDVQFKKALFQNQHVIKLDT